MSHSQLFMFVHIVWATKNRFDYFSKRDKEKVYKYIQQLSQEEKINLLAIGGTSDHVHLLINLRGAQSISDVVATIKSKSTKFIGKFCKNIILFAWQPGYAAFAVSPSMVNKKIRYIQKQEEHHKDMSLDEELLLFNKR